MEHEHQDAAPGNAREDKILTCSDCGKPFTFTGGEQAFYEERGFKPPRRCKVCRGQRKSERAPAVGGGGGGGYGGSGGGRSAGKDFHKAVCSVCGTETSVPFKPDPSRPIYCRNCYLTIKKGGPGQDASH